MKQRESQEPNRCPYDARSDEEGPQMRRISTNTLLQRAESASSADSSRPSPGSVDEPISRPEDQRYSLGLDSTPDARAACMVLRIEHHSLCSAIGIPHSIQILILWAGRLRFQLNSFFNTVMPTSWNYDHSSPGGGVHSRAGATSAPIHLFRRNY